MHSLLCHRCSEEHVVATFMWEGPLLLKKKKNEQPSLSRKDFNTNLMYD